MRDIRELLFLLTMLMALITMTTVLGLATPKQVEASNNLLLPQPLLPLDTYSQGDNQ